MSGAGPGHLDSGSLPCHLRRYQPMPASPTILVFDSGLGGLTVFREVARARPDARFIYVADDAFFPYGSHGEAELIERVLTLFDDADRTPPPRPHRHCLQHGIHAGAAGPARALHRALRRHRAGDQAGLLGLGDQARLGARHRGHRLARIHPRADPRFRQWQRRDAGRRGAARRNTPRPSSRARRSRTPRSRARSRPASSTRTAGAPTPSCSPARTTRSCSSACSSWRPGR